MQNQEFSAWRERLEAGAQLPAGFQTATARCSFVPAEKPDAGPQSMNLAVIRAESPTPSFAASFTRNAFPGWPIAIGRALMDSPLIQGVIVNNKVANVGTAGGKADSELIAEQAARIFGDTAAYLPSSTGVIGWKLPVSEMEDALPRLTASTDNQSLLPFAEAIMTTDSWPKVRCAECGDGLVVGAAKGAGMVEPNMATMLAFLLTDVDADRERCRRLLPEVVDAAFNRISIDGETSTSDTVFLMSSRRKAYPGDRAFRDSLLAVALPLAEDVVRNGEGCAHVFRVTAAGLPDETIALRLARSIANAPLTKTAVRGNDPNVGRIIQALGAGCARAGLSIDRNRLTLEIGGRKVFENGCFCLDDREEQELRRYLADRELPLPAGKWPLHYRRVEIAVTLAPGGKSASVIGSDLSEEYIKVNSDYRT